MPLRARASESSTMHKKPTKSDNYSKKPVTSHATRLPQAHQFHIVLSVIVSHIHCISVLNSKHYLIPRSSHLRSNHLCSNCLRPGHISKDCKSSHRCRVCQKLHHSLLHLDTHEDSHSSTVSSNTATGVIPDALLMTFQAFIKAPNGTMVKVRGLLNSASSASFISECLAHSLKLPLSNHQITIAGIAGLLNHSPLRSITTVEISSALLSCNRLTVTAIVSPQVTCNLPIHFVNQKSSWTHLSDLQLADPAYGVPGNIVLLLGVNVYAAVILQGRRAGPTGSPTAFETIFGWVLSGKTTSSTSISTHLCVTSNHTSTVACSVDDILKKFWEIEEPPKGSILDTGGARSS